MPAKAVPHRQNHAAIIARFFPDHTIFTSRLKEDAADRRARPRISSACQAVAVRLNANSEKMPVDEKLASPWSEVATSTKVVLPVDVCSQPDGTVLRLFLHVIRGSQPGPTLVLLGAIHGDEYEGPAALWKMFEALRPEDLTGTLVCVPVANPPAFGAGSRAAGDGKDLARTFPGSPTGTVTEQIAHLLHHRVIAHADFMCDFHSAGRFYRIDPWVGYGLVDNLQILERQRQAARCVGYPAVWGTQLLPGRSLWSAAQWGVPALYVEAPGEGRATPQDIERNCGVVRQLLSLMEMWEEPLGEFEPDLMIEDQREQSGYLQVQCVTRHGGYFEPAVEIGQVVEQDALFGTVRSMEGTVLEQFRTAHAGRVVFLRTFPVVEPGDSLGTVRDEQ